MFRRQTPAQIAADAARMERDAAAFAALLPDVRTWAQARALAAEVGCTVRPDVGGPCEDGTRLYEVFPKGDGRAARLAATPAESVILARIAAADIAANRFGFGGPSLASRVSVMFRAALAAVFPDSLVALAEVSHVAHGGAALAVSVSVSVPDLDGEPCGVNQHEFARFDSALALAAMEATRELADKLAARNARKTRERAEAWADKATDAHAAGLPGIASAFYRNAADGFRAIGDSARAAVLETVSRNALKEAAAQAREEDAAPADLAAQGEPEDVAQGEEDARPLPERLADLAALCAPVSARTGRRADVLAPLARGAAAVALYLARGGEPADALAVVTERNGPRYARALSLSARPVALI